MHEVSKEENQFRTGSERRHEKKRVQYMYEIALD
jgi:hypothetical protein